MIELNHGPQDSAARRKGRLRVTFQSVALVRAIAVGGIVAFPTATLAGPATLTNVRVARHADVTYIDTTLHDDAFSAATTALTTDDGSNDVACNLTLLPNDFYWYGPDPDPATAPNYDADIGGKTEYQTTQSVTPGYYTVVNTINWCGASVVAGGCGWPEGGLLPFLVTRDLAVGTTRGVVLAHEYGHTTGIAHTTSDRQIMESGPLATNNNKVVNSTTCNKFRTYFGFLEFGERIYTGISELGLSKLNQLPALDPPLLAPPDHVSKRPLVSKLLSSLDPPTPEVEDHYGEPDLKELRSILQDTTRTRHQRRMAASLIGLISAGSMEDRRAIEAHLRGPGAEHAAAMLALGYLVARLGDEEALATILGTFFSGGRDERESAALGLAVSGDARACDFLRGAGLSASNSTDQVSFATQAEECRRVEQIGLRAHYTNPPEPVWVVPPNLGPVVIGLDALSH